jgi:GT2 family glycosyltransferase
MASTPLISIVIATRNAAATLPRCLDSLRAQSFRDFEVIVMDGASTDGTVELLARAGEVVASWRSEADTGVVAAWNRALGLARGEWICFLGADDWLWDRDALARLEPVLRGAPPDRRVVYSKVRQVDTAGALIEERGLPWPEARAAFRSHSCLPHPGLMHHRSLFAIHGAFDERFRMAGDYEFLLRELKSGDALFVPSVTVGMGEGGLTTSPENYLRLLGETKEALRTHGLRPPRLVWAYWTLCAWAYLKLRALVGDRQARRLADLYRLLHLRKPRYFAE